MLNRKLFVLLMIALVYASLPACQLIDKPEQEPAWIQIDTFLLEDNPEAKAGSLSHDITDAWVFINEEMIGIHELPATIPILEEGNRRLLVGPGIKVSTISTLRDNYLFYEGFEREVNLVKGETLHIEPVSRYRNPEGRYNYELVDDFEDSFLEVRALIESEAEFSRTTDPTLVYQGNGSGLLNITDTATTAGMRTVDNYILPVQGQAVFLEMDYYTEYPLAVGVFIDNGSLRDQAIDYLTLRPDDSGKLNYKKAYISLTSTLSQATNLQSAYIYFTADVTADDAPPNGKVLIDNLKLMVEI